MKKQAGSATVLSRWQRLVKRFRFEDIYGSAGRGRYRPGLEELEGRQAPTDLFGAAVAAVAQGGSHVSQQPEAAAETGTVYTGSGPQPAAQQVTWFDAAERQVPANPKETNGDQARPPAPEPKTEPPSTEPFAGELASDPLDAKSLEGNVFGDADKEKSTSPSSYLADSSAALDGGSGNTGRTDAGSPAGQARGGNSSIADQQDADRQTLQTLVSFAGRPAARPGAGHGPAIASAVLTSPPTSSTVDWRPSDTDLRAAGFESMRWQGKEVFARPGEWIVRFDGITGSLTQQTAAIDRLVSTIGLSVKTVLGSDGLAVVRGPAEARFEDVVNSLSRLPGYRYAEPNQALWVRAMPNDPRFVNGDLWGLHNTGQNGGTADADIDAPEAWDIATGNSNIVVGVIDTGVDYTHPDLASNIWVNPFEIAGDGIDNDLNGFIDDIHGANFITGSGNPMDDHDHGTHVSGTIAGVGNNAVGVVGVNWTTQIMGLKFLSASGSGSIEDAIEALDYANDMRERGVNIRLTSNSWGGGGFSQAMKDEIDRSGSLGLLFVAAAGNSGQNADASPMYPAAYTSPNIISVAATDRNDNKASFSNWGATSVDLGAPGVDTWSTVAGGGYASFSGTSMATPHVAGVAALAFGRNDTLSWEFVKDAILNGVDPNNALRVGGPSPVLTGGRLNAFNTIQMIPGPTTAGPYVTNYSPRGTVNTNAISFIEFTFNDAMDTTSFAVAADVATFTGPGGVDLKPTITGFSWSADAKKLKINFAPKRGNGVYTMVIGPQILDALGRPMDSDYDGTPGEAIQDRYTATVTHAGGAGPTVVSHSPSATALSPTSITFTFSEAMNTTSFSVAADVASFTGPGGTNLLAQITGFSWVNSTTLKVNFNAQATEGIYTMVLGPQILAASDGAAMDQDADNLAGEATQDRYTASFLFDSAIGPDGFGYTASGTAPLNIDLVAGALGVVTLIDNVLDGFAALNLGTNTFNFYGTTYTGANQLFVSTEGVITFGSGTSQYWNENLTSTPSQATLAVLWDDWNTSLSSTDKVLYRFDDTNADGTMDRLIVEWDNVLHYDGGTAATFQAILSLNTGSNASEVIYNYRDLDVGTPTLSEGASATVGIKAAGTQGLRRLLVSQDTATSPFVGTGKAIRISRNVAGPFIINHTPTGTVNTTALSFLEFNFDVAVNPASFAVASDVASFTGPGGVDLKPAITGAVWSNGNKTLRINFTPKRANGTYTLVLGPGIQDTLGRSMDQDADGTAGEAIEDRYTATVAHSGGAGPRVTKHSPVATALAPSSITFTFSEVMNTGSFAVASDVVSFTGPGGSNLLAQITGFTWVNSTTLRVNFNAQVAEGTYSMVLGPQILAASDNAAMDQDGDNLAGEPGQDAYTASLLFDSTVGPDGFGYIATGIAPLGIDLVAGTPGVVTLIDGVLDGFAALNLGTNAFTFYGQTYTGANQLFVSTEGVITFGSGTSQYWNENLTATPPQATIAVLWDDWNTSLSSADRVLYRFDDTNADGTTDRLVVEWENVLHYNGGTAVTFQAILGLNGDYSIIYNYPDLDTGNASLSEGASATVGIKAAGTQGLRRLLISQDTATSPFVGTGKAIRITRNVAGPFIVNHAPTGTVDTTALKYLEFNFDVAINPASFTVASDVVSFTGPGGTNLKSTITSAVWSNGNKTLRLNFTPKRTNGTYTLVLGPSILDTLGRPMDQDADNTAGEAIQDRYTATVAHSGGAGPRVLSHAPTSTGTAPTSITFTFNEAMNTTSFAVADVRSFTGPGNQNLLSQITGFSWVNSTTLRVNFNAQPLEGTYTMAIGPQILAASDNRAMDQDRDAVAGEDVQDRYTATVKFSTALGPDGSGYEATAVALQAIDLVAGAPGVVTLIDNADDTSVALNLGTNTFRFYGTSYTGASQLFVSSNGLITFGSGNSDYGNADLTNYPAQRAIAPFWDDLHTGRTAADKVLYKFDDANADGTPERLIIEWSEVNFYSGGTQPITYQAILQLNTGTNGGAITFNYPDLIGGSASVDNGASATVGIKDTGAQGPNRLLVSFNTAASPYVGTGKAVRISQNGSISGQVFNDADGDGIKDSNEAGLANVTVYIDADNDGVRDAGEISVVSNSGGFYSLPHLPFGTYVVRQVVPTYYYQTVPASNGPRIVTLASGQNATGQNFGDRKPVVTIAATDATAAEPANTGTFRVTRTGPTTSPLTVYYTVSGTATAGGDYQALTGSVTIAAGATQAFFTVTPINDALVEGRETVIATLTADVSYTRGNTAATVTIHDDELPSLSVSAVDATATETAGNPARFRITRTPGTTAAMTVNYTVTGTAANGTDYVALSGTAVIAAGATFVDVTVTPINDTLVEGRETVTLNLVDNAAYQVLTRSATATIHDDELPTVSVAVVDSYAYEPGADTARFRISRTPGTSASLTVNYTLSGTAGNGVDYATLSGTVTIPANATFADIVVTALDDTLAEPRESVILTLSSSSTYQIGTASRTVYIYSNE